MDATLCNLEALLKTAAADETNSNFRREVFEDALAQLHLEENKHKGLISDRNLMECRSELMALSTKCPVYRQAMDIFRDLL